MLLERLEIPAGIDSPYICLDSTTGVCELTGKSYPEDITEFYDRVVGWFEEYMLTGTKDLSLNFKLTYYNSSSQKVYTDILEKLLDSKNFKVVVNWLHAEDDEDMLDAGQEFEKLVDLPFKFISYKR